jgi:hypothetical protein
MCCVVLLWESVNSVNSWKRRRNCSDFSDTRLGQWNFEKTNPGVDLFDPKYRSGPQNGSLVKWILIYTPLPNPHNPTKLTELTKIPYLLSFSLLCFSYHFLFVLIVYPITQRSIFPFVTFSKKVSWSNLFYFPLTTNMNGSIFHVISKK